MPTFESKLGAHPSIQSAQAGQVTVQRGTYDLDAVQLADNTTVVRIVRLPADHRIVEAYFSTEDLDTGATGVVDLGIEDTVQDPTDTTDSTLFATGVSVQAAADFAYKSKALQDLASRPYDRYVTVALTAAAGTPAAGAIAFELVSRPDLASHEGNFS